MVWIISYSERTPAAQAWSNNDNSGRTLIHTEAKAELSKMRELLKDENVKAVLDLNAYDRLAESFKNLSKWYIDYLKAEREF